MNSKNSKTSDPYRLLLSLAEQVNINLLYLILAYTIHGKILKIDQNFQIQNIEDIEDRRNIT